jgi:C-5 cytosine-specific DNA methylase
MIERLHPDKPLVVDLYCGLGGFSEGFLAEGYECVGFDIERHDYGFGGYPGTLILRDVRSIHGSELKDAAVIMASPPCQEPSYRAMPWRRAKALNAIGPPHNFIELFNECFRIQREASEAAGRYIPLIVENVRGAQKWVGRAQYHYGSFYLWGDVPALMPITLKSAKVSGFRFDGSGRSFQTASVEAQALHHINETGDGTKQGGDWWDKECRKTSSARYGSKSSARKAASALIAKIPFPLSQHIARVFKP